MAPKSVAVIQARMTSTRLPGKVLLPLGGTEVLSWVIRAAVESRVFHDVVVATSSDPSDDDVAELARRRGAAVVRGPLDDVLGRYVQAIQEFPADLVVRLTSDCPLLDPDLIRLLVRVFEGSGLDYLSTTMPRSLPRGLDVEVVSAAALRQADREATGSHRAHVTSFIHTRPRQFMVGGVVFRPGATRYRVTLDEPADLEALSAIVSVLGDRPPSWREVVRLLDNRPDIVKLNADVRQKRAHKG